MLHRRVLAVAQRRSLPNRAKRGLYQGVYLNNGVVPTFSGKKTKRTWKPNVTRTTFYSEILNDSFRLNVTNKAKRTIDKYYGFDSYLLNSKLKNLAPEGDASDYVAVQIRRRLQQAVRDAKDTREFVAVDDLEGGEVEAESAPASQ
jgi:large subunit ribosomal protein L28